MAGQRVEDPAGRQHYAFERRSSDGGELLYVDVWVDPGGAVPAHSHPRHEERFEVLEGEVTFTVGRRKVRAGAGERAVVPAGVRHAFRNPGNATAHMRVEVEPPMRLQEFLEDFAAVARAGLLGGRGAMRFPKGLKGLLQVSLLTRDYRQDETALVLSPPLIVQRLLMDPLARLAERRGYPASGLGSSA